MPVTNPGGWGTRLQEGGAGGMGGKSHLCVGGGGAQLAGSDWDSASRGEGPRSGRSIWASPRCSSSPLPLWLCLPLLLGLWTTGEREEKIGEEKGPEQPRNGSGGALTTGPGWPDPNRPTRAEMKLGRSWKQAAEEGKLGWSRGLPAARVS